MTTTINTLKLNSGTFAYDKFESKNGNKSYRIVCKPTIEYPKEKIKEIAIMDGGNLQMINGEYWITF